MDNAASTPVDARVRREMDRATRLPGNPSSYNDAGRKAAGILSDARLKTARFLGAQPGQIVFCSSGSEANNLAILGTAFAQDTAGGNILTTPVEHLSVLEPVKFLEHYRVKTKFLEIDGRGMADLADLERKLNARTILVSVMYANNEVGTIQPIAKIGKLISHWRREHKTDFPLFHVDACQAAGYLNMNVNHLDADLVTFNGSKIYGPRGAGVLYVRNGVKLPPLIMGGGQEHGLRAGTENLPAIAGLAKAIELIDRGEFARLSELRDFFISELTLAMPDVRVNGALGRDRLPNNVSVSFPGLDSENLLIELDKYGIRAGSGSACTARSVQPSHVLKALGVKKPYLDGALRFSLGRQTTKKDIQRILKILPKVIAGLKERYGRIRKFN